MKVYEILSEGMPNDEVYWNSRRGVITGGIKNFITRIGATDDDVQTAIKNVKRTAVWKKVTSVMRFVSNDKELKNGTLVFDRLTGGGEELSGRWPVPDGGIAPNYHYELFVNGQIRMFGPSSVNSYKTDGGKAWKTIPGKASHTRLKSPEPAFNESTPLKVLVTTYTNALNEIYAKYLKTQKEAK